MAVSYLDYVYVCLYVWMYVWKTYVVQSNNFKCHFCKKTHSNNFKYHNSILLPSIKMMRIRLTEKSLHKLKNEYPTIGPFRNLLKIRITALYSTLICETGSVAKTASTKTVLHYMLSAKKKSAKFFSSLGWKVRKNLLLKSHLMGRGLTTPTGMQNSARRQDSIE